MKKQKESNTNKALITISWITILSAIGLLLTVAFWLLYPYKPAEYKNLPQKVDKEVYKIGEQIKLSIDFCRYMSIVPTINRSFVDGIVYNLHGTVSPTSDLGCHLKVVSISVPQTIQPGKYHISTNFRYKVNPLREIEIITISEDFTVIK